MSLKAAIFAIGVGVLGAVSAGCERPNTPEAVADAFVDAYFRHADQERAKELTAFGATKMLEDELREVKEARNGEYTPGGVSMSIQRGESTARDHRVRVHYEIEIDSDGAKSVRDADIELSQVQGVWKVVRVGLQTRTP